jgi:hypothetical protein
VSPEPEDRPSGCSAWANVMIIVATACRFHTSREGIGAWHA